MTQLLQESPVESCLNAQSPFLVMLTIRTGENTSDKLVLDCPLCGKRVPCPGRAHDGSPLLAECLPCDLLFDYRPDAVYSPAQQEWGHETPAA